MVGAGSNPVRLTKLVQTRIAGATDKKMQHPGSVASIISAGVKAARMALNHAVEVRIFGGEQQRVGPGRHERL